MRSENEKTQAGGLQAWRRCLPLRLNRVWVFLFLPLCFALRAEGEMVAREVDDELRRLLLDTIETADSFEDRFDAEVWLVAMSSRMERFVKEPKRRLSLLRSIHRAATRAGLQPEIVLAVIEVESRFDRFAVSHAGAQGMMQVMPFWKNEIGRPEDNLIDLETNLKYGCTILKYYLDKAKGEWAEALARYNGSYGSYRYSIKVMDAWDRWR